MRRIDQIVVINSKMYDFYVYVEKLVYIRKGKNDFSDYNKYSECFSLYILKLETDFSGLSGWPSGLRRQTQG